MVSFNCLDSLSDTHHTLAILLPISSLTPQLIGLFKTKYSIEHSFIHNAFNYPLTSYSTPKISNAEDSLKVQKDVSSSTVGWEYLENLVNFFS